MRKWKRWIGAFLVAAVLTAAVPVGTFTARAANTAYAVEGGNLYFDPATGAIVDCDTSVTKAVIPGAIDGVPVTSIAGKAFYRCRLLTSLTVPESVTSVERSAFYECNALTSLELPGVTYIGLLAFENCYNLASITVGGSEVYVDGGAFRYCSGLADVVFSGTVTFLGNYAFDGCSSLEEFRVTGSDLAIGNYTFDDCNALKKVELSGVVKSIGNGAFWYCSSLADINLPEGLVSIGEIAFDGCSKLTEFYLPASLTTLGNSALRSGSGLRKITVAPGSKSFSTDEYGVLYNYDKTELVYYLRGSDMTSYTLPDTVTKIPDGAFSTCENLREIVLPDGITDIGPYTFEQCYNLESIKLPAALKTIGEDAFYNCWSLREITLPEGLTEIGSQAFIGCRMLGTVKIPGGVKTINRATFNGCYSLQSVSLGEGIEQIGANAFYGCTGLLDISLPDSLKTVGNSAFYKCSALRSIVLPERVTAIGSDAFSNCYNLTYAVMPQSLASIGNYAFWHCYDLRTIVIPESVTAIGSSAFVLCDAVTIHGTSGSYAETYANENGIPFSAEKLSSVYGYILTAAAEPVSEVKIILTDTDNGDIHFETATDESGAWTVPVVQIGHHYSITYDHPEYPDNGLEYAVTAKETPAMADYIIVAKTGFMNSGSKQIKKLNWTELNYMMQAKLLEGPLFRVEPSLQQPYSSGALSEEALLLALERLNESRRIAGLPGVKLNEKANQYCQDAALINMLNWTLSHYPSRPSGVDDALYQSGYTGASNSNLALHPNSGAFCGPVGYSVDLWLEDSDSANVADVGHRRWALNPTMAQTGFGCVTSGVYYFSAMYSTDKTGPGVEYDFIAWPSSGNFPLEHVPFDLAWSVTLNPEKYGIPNEKDLTVTFTEVETGNTYVLTGDRQYSVNTFDGNGEYLNLSTEAIGVRNCIIFRPASFFISQGVYVVEIDGVRELSGKEACIRYYVNLQGTNHGETATEYGFANYGLEWHMDRFENFWLSGISELACKMVIASYDPSGRLIDKEYMEVEQLESVSAILDCPEGSLIKIFRMDEANRPMTVVWSHQF